MFNLTVKNSRKIFSAKDFPPRLPWMHCFTQAPNTLIIGEKARVFFSTREQLDSKKQYKSRPAYFDISLDGNFKIHNISQEPVLNLGDKGSFDEFGIYPFCPIEVKDEVYAVYAGWTRSVSVPFDVALGLAKANRDRTRFERIGVGPVISKSQYEPFVISSPKIRFFNGRYFLFYIAGSRWIRIEEGKLDIQYTIRMAVSDDLLSWRKLNRELIKPVRKGLESQASPDVFQVGNLYIMMFCHREVGNFQNKSRGYELGLAFSKDLLNWKRCDSRLVLELQNSLWDNESQNYPHVFKLPTGQHFLLYTGNGIGESGLGIAELEF